jgi:hypothetical protein
VTPTTVGLVLAELAKQSPLETTDLNHLDYLGVKIKHHHGHVMSHLIRALDEARDCGEFVAKAKPVWLRLRACGHCKLRWEEWLRQVAGVSRNTANNYLRIYVHYDKLERLPSDQRSITAAIEYIRTLEGGSAIHRAPRPHTVTVKVADLVEAATRHNIQDVVDPVKLVAVFNDLLKMADISKIIKLDTMSE